MRLQVENEPLDKIDNSELLQPICTYRARAFCYSYSHIRYSLLFALLPICKPLHISH